MTAAIANIRYSQVFYACVIRPALPLTAGVGVYSIRIILIYVPNLRTYS